MRNRYLIATDASVDNYSGVGYIIHSRNEEKEKHKIIVRKLDTISSSSAMELHTVLSAFSLVNAESEVHLINDCDLMWSIDFHAKSGFKNKHNKRSTALELLMYIHAVMNEKKISLKLISKQHPWHDKCDEGCRLFKEAISKSGKEYKLFYLNKYWEASYLASYSSKRQAQLEAKIHKKILGGEVVISLCREYGKHVTDLHGKRWKVNEI